MNVKIGLRKILFFQEGPLARYPPGNTVAAILASAATDPVTAPDAAAAEGIAVLFARRQMERADVVVLVVDASQGILTGDLSIAGEAWELGRGVIDGLVDHLVAGAAAEVSGELVLEGLAGRRGIAVG